VTRFRFIGQGQKAADMGTPSTSSATAPEVTGPDLRTRLLRSATALFSAHGYVATSMRAVAEGAGCTKPNLYYHFGSKEALFAKCLHVEGQGYVELIGEAFARQAPVAERLRVAMGLFFEHVRADPAGMRLVYNALEAPDPGQPSIDATELRGGPVSMTADLIQVGIAGGEIRSDLNVEDAVLALLGMVDHRCRRLVFEGEPIPEDCPERLVDIFFNGVSK